MATGCKPHLCTNSVLHTVPELPLILAALNLLQHPTAVHVVIHPQPLIPTSTHHITSHHITPHHTNQPTNKPTNHMWGKYNIVWADAQMQVYMEVTYRLPLVHTRTPTPFRLPSGSGKLTPLPRLTRVLMNSPCSDRTTHTTHVTHQARIVNSSYERMSIVLFFGGVWLTS
jgi:hypothetical protein